MSGDNGKQLPRTRSKKRRHLCIVDTDSSDDAAVSTMKPRRKPRISVTDDLRECERTELKKTTEDTSKKDRDKSSDSEIAGSSKSEVDKKPVEKTKEESPPKNVKKEAKNSRDSKSRRSSETSKKAAKNAVESPAVEVKKDENSDESAEHCSICWLPFKEQEVAVPTTCDHSFCLKCILKWSGRSNTCPVDRLTFNMIDVHQNYGGKKLRQMPIETRTLPEAVTGDEAGGGDNPLAMLFSNSSSSEWGNDSDDLSILHDSNGSLMDTTSSDFGDSFLEAFEQDGSSSLSCQNGSSPSLSDDSNVETSDNLSTLSHRSATLRQSSSSESPDASISSIDSLASFPSPPSLDTSSSSTSY